MANDMGFVIPFKTAVESPNLFVKQDVAYTAEGAYTDEDLVMIPIYVGAGDEAKQGLCTGT